MKAKLFFFILFISFVSALAAQDTIYRTDNTRIVVKVLEVSQEEVRYTRPSLPDSPVFRMETDDLVKIVYSNGETDSFNASRYERKYKPVPGVYRRMMIGVNAFDAMFGVLTITGQYDFGEHLALRIPVSFGANAGGPHHDSYNEFFYYSKDKLFSVGASLLYFPYGHNRRANFYFGPTLEFGAVNRTIFDRYGFYPYYEPLSHNESQLYLAGGFTAGVQFRVSDHVDISLDGTVGAMTSQSGYFQPMVRMGATVGFRFGQQVKAPDGK